MIAVFQRALYPPSASAQYSLKASLVALNAARFWRQAPPGSSFRPFHSTTARGSGSFLNLSGLSVSRESRFLSKEQGIPRTEFSPHLELIRSGEVVPFTGKDPSLKVSHSTISRPSSRSSHHNLHNVGYLMKELETARNINTKSEAAFRDLHAKYLKREKEAALLAMFTAILLLSVLFSQELELWLDPALQWCRGLWQDIFSLYAGVMPRHDLSLKVEGLQNLETVDYGEEKSVVSPMCTTSRAPWSRLLWASPD